MCGNLEKKCLTCYDMACGITHLQKKILATEKRLKTQKIELETLLAKEAAGRIECLIEYTE